MKIYHTRGVYPNGEFKDNAVRAEDLEGHIEYNKLWRFGRALLVNGEVVYKGFVPDDVLAEHIGVVKEYTKPSKLYY